MKSIFIGFDNAGGDGSDPTKSFSVYRVLDDDGFEHKFFIPHTEPDEQAALKKLFVAEIGKVIPTDHGKDVDVVAEVAAASVDPTPLPSPVVPVDPTP